MKVTNCTVKEPEWLVTGCIFSGPAPAGCRDWKEWFDRAIKSKKIEGVEIRALEGGGEDE
jgi:hypothetical protein